MAGSQTDPPAAITAGAVPKRRGTELALPGFAVLVTLAAQCIVDIALTDSLRPQMAEFGVWIIALWGIAHLAVRKLAPDADPLLLPAVALLVGLGQAEIHRLDLGGNAASGAMSVIVLYLILVERGLRTSLVVRDALGKLLAAGLAFGLAWQVFVILDGVTGLLPLTGHRTTFLAYGGSSVVATFGLVAVLVRISDAARRPATPHAGPLPQLGDAPIEVVQQ